MTKKEEVKGRKRCYICGKIKQLKSFFKDKTRRDGVQSRCKECNRVQRYNFECPNCQTKHSGNVDKPMPCPKCWRVSIAKSKNY